MIKGQYRYSILQVPAEITPLKLRGYLRQELDLLQKTTVDETDIVIVRLFVLEKILFALGPVKVDKLLGGLAGKFPNVQRIELEALLRPLSEEEMHEAAAEAHSQLKNIGEAVMKNPYLV